MARPRKDLISRLLVTPEPVPTNQSHHWFDHSSGYLPTHPRYSYVRSSDNSFTRKNHSNKFLPGPVSFNGRILTVAHALFLYYFPTPTTPYRFHTCRERSTHPDNNWPIRCCNPWHATIELLEAPAPTDALEPLDTRIDELATLMGEWTSENASAPTALFEQLYVSTGDWSPQELYQALAQAKARDLLTPRWVEDLYALLSPP